MIPPGIEGTLILAAPAAIFGWFYGFVGYVGYAKQVARADPERTIVARSSMLLAVGLVFVVRHVLTGDIFTWTILAQDYALKNWNVLVVLLFGLPLTLLLIAAGLAGMGAGLLAGASGIFGAFYYLPGFFMGLPIVSHWVFVRHPAEPIVTPALREGRELDTKALRNALMPNPKDLKVDQPKYRYENQAAKARALKEKLDADAEIAKAAMRRERARAELDDAEREVREAERRAKGRRS